VHKISPVQLGVGVKKTIGGHEVNAGVVLPPGQQCLQHARGCRLSDRHAPGDADYEGHRPVGILPGFAEELRGCGEQALPGGHLQVDQPSQRQINLFDLEQVDLFTEPAQADQLLFGELERSRHPQRPPLSSVELHIRAGFAQPRHGISVAVSVKAMEPDHLIREYLLLGLRFDRIEEGYVDAFTGDPRLRRQVADEPAPDPAGLARQADRLLADLRGVPRSSDPAAGFTDQRADFIAAHLRALACAGRRFAGEDIGFVDEVRHYFDVEISRGDPDHYRAAHVRIDEVLGGTGGLVERMEADRRADEIPPERLEDCIRAFSSALRDVVRATYPLPDTETVVYEVVTDKPWSGFNYYEGDYRSTVAINADLKQQMSNLPGLVAHESYPGHHTEHCRKEAGLVAGLGHGEQTIFLVNTPQCLMAEGLADLALHAAVGPGWGTWAAEIYADLGLRFDGERAEALSQARAALAEVRQDAALMLHDEHRDLDDVAAFLQRWLLVDDTRARQSLKFLSSPLWRAYTSTYVEGYRLLRTWLDDRPAAVGPTERFGRLLDEPLIPSALRAELTA